MDLKGYNKILETVSPLGGEVSPWPLDGSDSRPVIIDMLELEKSSEILRALGQAGLLYDHETGLSANKPSLRLVSFSLLALRFSFEDVASATPPNDMKIQLANS